MSKYQDKKIWDLLVPGTHNSAAYMSKNYIPLVKKYMICQTLSILNQLRIGVRYFDFRVVGYKPGEGDDTIQWWCGHTFLAVPLSKVVSELMLFIEEYPTEVIFFEVKPDWSPVNMDSNLFKRKRNES